MKDGDEYLKWVEWSDADQGYIGRCPDLFLGGCHGDDPVQVYAELCGLVAEMAADYRREGKTLPPVTVRPLAAA